MSTNEPNSVPDDPARPHIVGGEFQSDKYPTCPRGKVPLSIKDKTAQDLLWTYAQRRRAVDAEFAADLETCLRATGYTPSVPDGSAPERVVKERQKLCEYLSGTCVAKLNPERPPCTPENCSVVHFEAIIRADRSPAHQSESAEMRELLEETVKQLESYFEDGAPVDSKQWIADLRAALSKAKIEPAHQSDELRSALATAKRFLDDNIEMVTRDGGDRDCVRPANDFSREAFDLSCEIDAVLRRAALARDGKEGE